MQEQTTIEKTELKIPSTLKALVEALIFAAQEPLSINQIRAICQGDNERNNGTINVETETIKQSITDLNKEYEKAVRPYRIIQIAGGFQFATLSVYAEWLGRLYKEQGRRKLSQSGVETLSIVAYKQPVTKAEIEKIRGVNCDYVLKTLLEKELVAVTGRAESVGRPLLYGTTKEFLKHFGLNDVTDLPKPREIEEILGESQFEIERRMLEAQQGAENMKKEQEDFKSRLPHIPKKKSELDSKDVEIVQNKKTREIKIVPAADQKIPDETGQESIVFNAEEVSLEDKNPAAPAIDDKIITELGAVEEKMSSVSESAEANIADDVEVERKDVEETIDTPVKTNAEEIRPEKETKSGTVLESGKEYSQHPGRWKVWKEKIQGFIKKLFA
ncbi:MAG: SMC-Scp complex subunit ScpB [Bacteroidetes bacterium]|nr:SMC-Scp complex subunit ScpB [Bacteroidota bacterium]